MLYFPIKQNFQPLQRMFALNHSRDEKIHDKKTTSAGNNIKVVKTFNPNLFGNDYSSLKFHDLYKHELNY